ncbi:ubiquitin-conjugating enzyme/RWD-like protein [Phlyctochytrium arcticum]|nr:ubiquitin-conjugating enzyme/RWD-like protein [Phlyctochytrium arcticum]
MEPTGGQYSATLRRYEIALEFQQLNKGGNCPAGFYVKPSPESIFAWFGVMFIHRGYYKEGVFQFLIQIPPDYPSSPPTVRFLNDIYHPLIHQDGSFNLTAQFPKWRPRKDLIWHVLYYMKNAFRTAVIDSLDESACRNVEAYRTFLTDRPLFTKMAAHSAQESLSDEVLYNENSISCITFSPLSDEEFEKIKKEMFASVGGASLEDIDSQS